MNSRDLALVSTSAIFGALISALAFRFSSSNPKFRRVHSTEIAAVSRRFPGLDPFSPLKRKGYLSWDDYFMAIAFLSAERSKDPNRQVGACLVSQNGVILGIGYNGFPRGCSDDRLPWAKKSKTGNPLETKYPYVCHAEVNSILNTNHASAAGQKLYVTMFPCNECAKIIIQSGVAEVIYFVEKRLNDSDVAYVASHKLLAMANIKVGACLVSQNGVILGIGFSRGCSDDRLPWAKSGVAEVIYFVEKRINDSDVAYVASHKLLAMANIKETSTRDRSDLDQV